jgi:hypothetical protein
MNKYTCNKCKKCFSTKQSLIRHLNKKISCDRKITCDKCGLIFDTKQHLLNHSKMKGNCLINKLNNIQINKETLLENFINYNTLLDKILDLIELIKHLESLNNVLLKEILNLCKLENKTNEIKSKILSNKIKINEITIFKKIKKIKLLDKFCNKFMFNISNISNKNKYPEINELLNNINKIGMKELPILSYNLWNSYKEFHNYFEESDNSLVYCKIGKQIICIKNNGKIFKFELGKVLLKEIIN